MGLTAVKEAGTKGDNMKGFGDLRNGVLAECPVLIIIMMMIIMMTTNAYTI